MPRFYRIRHSGHVGIDRQFAELAEVGTLLMEELAREERGYEQNEELGRKTRIRAFGSRRAERYDHGDTDADHTPRRRSDGWFPGTGEINMP